MDALQVADRLDGAAALIEERGHAKGVLQDASGALCMAGAIIVAVEGFIPPDCSPHSGPIRFDPYIRPVILACGNNYIGRWNDAPQRTAAEVCAVLRRAAALARASVQTPEVATVEGRS